MLNKFNYFINLFKRSKNYQKIMKNKLFYLLKKLLVNNKKNLVLIILMKNNIFYF